MINSLQYLSSELTALNRFKGTKGVAIAIKTFIVKVFDKHLTQLLIFQTHLVLFMHCNTHKLSNYIYIYMSIYMKRM